MGMFQPRNWKITITSHTRRTEDKCNMVDMPTQSIRLESESRLSRIPLPPAGGTWFGVEGCV